MIEVIVICALIALLIAQHFFWSLQVQSLVNKLMSRNYSEYQQAKGLEMDSKPEQFIPETFDPSTHEDLRSIGG